MFNRIAMIGLGDIGLPTAALFASRKRQVIGIDISIQVVEPELDRLISAAVSAADLRAMTTPEDDFRR